MVENDHETRKMVMVDEKYCYKEEIELTVHKRSLFSKGDGFIVYNPNGDIIFRVDFYSPIKHHALLLMDTFGKPLLTLIPKRPTLHQRLKGFLGETTNDQQPIFSIWKSTMFGRSRVMVEVFQKASHSSIEYQIEGPFGERNCTICMVRPDTSAIRVAEIKRKVESKRKLVLSSDVFSLIVKPGADAAFVMSLVLALDRIDGNDVA